MKRKTIAAILLVLCMLAALLPVSAAAKVNAITLTNSIIPTGANTALKFASGASPSKPAYSIMQVWSLGIAGEKMYTNSDLYNQMLAREGQLMDEADRVLKPGKTYVYMIMITPNNKSDFSENLTVKSGGRTFTKINNENGDYIYAIGFYYDTKLHISSPGWKSNESSHWFCADDGFVFEDITQPHDFNRTTYACDVCGYVTPEHMTTTITKEPQDITATCGDTVELSVGATGANLRYNWKWGKDNYSLYDSDDYYGMKISGCYDSTIRLENFNGRIAEDYNGLYCLVDGSRGSANTRTAKITVVHNKNVYEKIDGNGHKILCSCGKVMTKSEPHTYVNNVCTKCGYRKGSTPTEFKSATLYAPDFAIGKTISDASASLRLEGDGISGILGQSEWQYYSDPHYYPTLSSSAFDESSYYRVKVYPVFESNYTMTTGSAATIVYNGNEMTCNYYTDNSGGGYFYIPVGQAPQNIKMTFDPNGGEGTQAPLYIDKYNDIYFPECTFTKEGDEFFAWKFNGNFYDPDPEKLMGCKISKNETAVAIWKSQVTKDISLTMDAITDGMNPGAVTFSSAAPSEYSVTSCEWYIGDSVDYTKRNLDKPLDTDKNYTVRISVKCSEANTGFAAADDLNVTLNGVKITSLERRSSQQLLVTAKILNDVGLDFCVPAENIKLPSKADMAKSNDKFDMTVQWFPSADAELKDRLSPLTEGTLGTTYYLRLDFKSTVENQIIGSGAIKVNGAEYPVSSHGSSTVRSMNIPFTATPPQVRISESDLTINIKAPKAMTVTVAAVLYDNASGKVNEIALKSDVALEKGINPIGIGDIVGNAKLGSFLLRIGTSVKIMVFENMGTLSPSGTAHDYQFKIKT